MPIDAIGGVNSLTPTKSIFQTEDLKPKDNSSIPFAEYLNDAMNKTNELLLESDRLADDFAAGRTDSIHQVMIAAEKADVALQFTLQIRNKIMDAYNEIMRMQI